MNFKTRHDTTLWMLIAALALLVRMLPAQSAEQRYFSSSTEAVDSLIAAVRAGDTAAVAAIFGPDSAEVISSGDPVEDENARKAFLASFDAAHRLVTSGENQLRLEIGNDRKPFAIPLVKKGDKWYFDTAAGKEELLYRRIGGNELAAIGVCHGVVSAQREYESSGHDGAPSGAYAQKLLSHPDKHDGLYWQTTEGEPESPLGPLVANAGAEGYTDLSAGAPAPYHGYYYRILTKQGGAAPGGSKSYIQEGRMSAGFGLLAYPAEYRNSGVTTFMVNQNGIVYQKDLGENTVETAQKINEYNPDTTWSRVK